MAKTLVTSYTHPDLDAVSCVVAYTELLKKQGKHVDAKIFGTVHDEVQYVCDHFKISCPLSITSCDEYDELILVDASDTGGLDKSIKPAKVIEIIDHRMQNESHMFANARLQIEKVGSAATLVAEKFKQVSMDPSPESALLLYGAIVSNTLNFKAKVTTERDNEMAKWLKSFIDVPDSFAHDMFAAKSDLRGAKLQDRIISDFAWFSIAGKRESIIQLEIVDAGKLIETRKPELLQELHRFRDEMNLDIFLVSLVDLLANRNFFVTDDFATQKMLSSIFHIPFSNSVALHPGLIMRKEITPKIREYLESQI